MALAVVALLGLCLVAPAKGASSQSRETPVVVESATWMAGGVGSWATFTTTLQATGLAFSGELRLVPTEPESALAARQTAARPAKSVTRSPSVSGARAPSVTVPPAIEPRGAMYRVPVAVEAGARRTVSVVVAVGDSAYRPEVYDAGGRRVATGPAQAPPTPNPAGRAQLTIGFLSDVADGSNLLRGPAGSLGHVVPHLGEGDGWLDGAVALQGYDVVVLDDFDAGRLDDARRQALADYVSLGGSLIVGGGDGGVRTAAGLPAPLVPLLPTATATASLAPVAGLAGDTTTATTTVVTGELRSGRVVLGTAGAPPLMVEANVGSGRVIQVTYDLLAVKGADPVVEDNLRAVTLTTALLRARLPGPLVGVAPPSQPGRSDELAAAIARVLQERAAEGKPPLPPATILLCGYAVLAGPGLFLAMRRYRSPLVLWLVAPGLSVAAAALVAGLLVSRQPVDDHEVTVERIAETSSRVDASHLLERRGGTAVHARLEPGGQASVDPATRSDEALPGRPGHLLDPIPGPRVDRAASDGTVRIGPTETRLKISAGTRSDARLVRTLTAARPRVVIESHLRLRAGRLEGTVTNHGTALVRRVHAVTTGRAQALLAAVLPPGSTLTVDAALEAPPTPGPSGTGPRSAFQQEETLLRAAARPVALAATAGQVAVVGLAPSAPNLHIDGARTSSSLGVVVTTAEVESADALNADLGFGVARPVYYGNATSVHELRLPAVPADSFTLLPPAKTPTDPPVFIYQAGTATWRSLQLGIPNRLSTDDAVDGRVLVRGTASFDPSSLELTLARP